MKVGIIGAGAMGRGIAQVAATAGCEVVVSDQSQEAMQSSQAYLIKIMNRLVEKERVTQRQSDQIRAAITYTDTLSTMQDCDLVIEAIVEKLTIKQQVIQAVEKEVSQNCIIASNTSSLSITCLLYTSPSPRDQRGSRMPSSA